MSLKINPKLLGAGLAAPAILAASFLIIPYEGKVVNKQGYHVAYVDAVGVHSACYGQTGKDLYGRTIKKGTTYTEEECLKMLSTTIKKFEKEISQVVKVPYSSPFQQAGVLSFTYNVGVTNLKSSSLLRKLNAKDYGGACGELLKWIYAKGIKLKGLETRRYTERQWCLGNVPQEVTLTYNTLMLAMVKQSSKTPTAILDMNGLSDD